MGNCHINKVTPLGLASSPELKLWRAVLAAACVDAIDENILDYKGNYILTSSREANQDYFLTPRRSFFVVCNNAGINPDYVLRKMIPKIKQLREGVQHA